MWNYRVVCKKEQTCVSYAIHEAYYDKNGKVGSITQESVNPFGDNIEELRHCWVMMAEAFGQPVLDYDNIPESGYDRNEDPVGTVLAERMKKFEAGDEELIPWEKIKTDIEEKYGYFDKEQYEKELENDRKKKEKIHENEFVGVSTLEELIKSLHLDYKKYLKQNRDENCIYSR